METNISLIVKNILLTTKIYNLLGKQTPLSKSTTNVKNVRKFGNIQLVGARLLLLRQSADQNTAGEVLFLQHKSYISEFPYIFHVSRTFYTEVFICPTNI